MIRFLSVVGSGPRVAHGMILETVISLEYLNQAFLVNYFENCLESQKHFLKSCFVFKSKPSMIKSVGMSGGCGCG